MSDQCCHSKLQWDRRYQTAFCAGCGSRIVVRELSEDRSSEALQLPPEANELAAMARDAARYRWLRANAHEVYAGETVEWEAKYGNLPAQLDDYLDAAKELTYDR